MAETRSSSERTRARAGLGLIAALMLLAAGVFFLDVAVRATAEGDQVIVLADAAPGLSPGSAVWVSGRPVGRVLSVDFRPPGAAGENVVIRAALDRAVGSVLRADASADVRASDLLAPVIVAIDPGTGSEPPWAPGDTLRVSGPRLDQEALLAMADTLLAAARRLRTQAADTRAALDVGSGSIHRLRGRPEVMAGIERDFARLSDLLSRRLPASSLGRLAADTAIGSALRRSRERMERWSVAPEREASRRGLETARAALDRARTRLAALSERVASGEGSVGRALHDREIERQIETLRGAMRALAEELALDPSRWLRVRVF